ncbi:hypothetical protein [Metasolibacillus sp. FSL K6-0083]|uniref:hypothetical protein n=1 Tax=Metasolibacillus sp. FSL K6-0083 TaxID=2921416 RepID=UPI00315B1957
MENDSAEEHSGFYSPPEEGDSVQLIIPSLEERSAFVRQSLCQNGDTNPKTAEADTAYWGNANSNAIQLDQQAVTLTATVYISVHQDSGMEVQSQHPLAVTVGGNLVPTGNTMRPNPSTSRVAQAASCSMAYLIFKDKSYT